MGNFHEPTPLEQIKVKGDGPEVYRLATAHRPTDAHAALQRVVGARVTRLLRVQSGSSHAVYLVTLADGRECVARFATHPEHALARELWAAEQGRLAGLPVPRVFAADLAPADGGPPFGVLERLPGRTGARVRLRPAQRTAVLYEMGCLAARLHAVSVPGVGVLQPYIDAYTGASRSWWDYVQSTLERRLAKLPVGALAPDLETAVRRRIQEGQLTLEAVLPAGAAYSQLVHGDFRLENALLAKDDAGQLRVGAILDFEMAIAGDGAVDLAWLIWQDARDERHRAAILSGYGAPAADADLHHRLRLYQLLYALEHLWWKTSFADRPGADAVIARIQDLVAAPS